MEEYLLVPKKEAPQDVAYYKSQLTGNAWLDRAGNLAAQKKRILEDKNLTDEEIVDKVKPIANKLRHANKRLRQIPPAGENDVGEGDDDLITTSLEKWMKRLAKNMEKTTTPKTTTPPPKRLKLEQYHEQFPTIINKDGTFVDHRSPTTSQSKATSTPKATSTAKAASTPKSFGATTKTTPIRTEKKKKIQHFGRVLRMVRKAGYLEQNLHRLNQAMKS